MSYGGFDNLDSYAVAPEDIYGSNWADLLRTLLCSDSSLFAYKFLPPVKGQRYLEGFENEQPMKIAVAGGDFPSTQPRIILAKRNVLKGNSVSVKALPDKVQCYCQACVAARLKEATPPPGKWNKQPLIGSIVRYVTCDGVILPAIVLSVLDQTYVYLQVFGGADLYKWAQFRDFPVVWAGPEPTPGTWHWPND